MMRYVIRPFAKAFTFVFDNRQPSSRLVRRIRLVNQIVFLLLPCSAVVLVGESWKMFRDFGRDVAREWQK